MSESEYKIKFFGRRKGKKMRPTRASLLQSLLPRIKIELPASDKGKINPKNFFKFVPSQVWLEVGFGGGEHLAEQARRNPDVGIIGAEVFLNGVASLLSHLAGPDLKTNPDGSVMLEDGRADNVCIYDDDVRLLFDVLSDACFDRIFVLFPDPWPKKRHAERRFIGPVNLPVLARLLKAGGELRIASDDMTYIRWSLKHLLASDDFEWTAKTSDDWNMPPVDWVNTRYEQKAINAGRKPIYLSFRKKRPFSPS